MKTKKKIPVALIFALLFTSIQLTFSPNIETANAATITTVPSSDPNIHYWVGNGYYDVWKNTSGEWTGDGKKPGDIVDIFNYSLDITIPDRTVVSISAFKFDVEMLDGYEIYRKSRYGQEYSEIANYVTDQSFNINSQVFQVTELLLFLAPFP
jgi:hypothetical protein